MVFTDASAGVSVRSAATDKELLRQFAASRSQAALRLLFLRHQAPARAVLCRQFGLGLGTADDLLRSAWRVYLDRALASGGHVAGTTQARLLAIAASLLKRQIRLQPVRLRQVRLSATH